MDKQDFIQHSNHTLLIDLNLATMEDIVKKKLFYCLDQKPLEAKLLKLFCDPVEQALIEILLRKNMGHQIKTAKALGINRNTLKKKITQYKIDIPTLLTKDSFFVYPSRLFLSSLSSLNLLTVFRSKLYFDNAFSQLPDENVLDKIYYPIEETVIQCTLKHFKYNKYRTALSLGLNRNTLNRKLSATSKNGVRVS